MAQDDDDQSLATAIYPYRGGRITMQQATNFIASILYPSEDKRVARKRIRERIRYSTKQGRLKGSEPFSAAVFFDTVLELYRDWCPLRTVKGLPSNGTAVSLSGVGATVMVGQVRVLTPPGDVQGLLAEYHRLDRQLEAAKSELAIANAALLEAKLELDLRRKREAEISRQRTLAGRLGGRKKGR